MVETTDLWDSIVAQGVAILDFEQVVSGAGDGLLLAKVAETKPHPQVLVAAHAAIEIDKLIALDLAGPEAEHAIAMRRVLLEAMSATAPSDDLQQATAAVLDRYRLALAAAVRRACGDDPASRLVALGSPHA